MSRTDHKGLFKKGNPGKPKGAITHLNKSVKDAFKEAFDSLQDDPKANLLAWGKKNPTYFYQIASKLIPSRLEAEVNDITQKNKMKLPDGTVIEF